MKPSSFLLVASISVNLALVVYVLRTRSTDHSGEASGTGLAARLQPGESQGKSIPSPYEQNEVRNTLTKHATAPVQACFRELTAKDPSLRRGMVQVDWQILPAGTTKNPEIVSSDLPAMNDCIVRVMKGLEFPPPPTDRPVYLSHKFLFKAAEEPSNAPVQPKQ